MTLEYIHFSSPEMGVLLHLQFLWYIEMVSPSLGGAHPYFFFVYFLISNWLCWSNHSNFVLYREVYYMWGLSIVTTCNIFT